MKKKFAFLVVVIVVIIAIGVLVLFSSVFQPSKEPINLSEKDNGKTLRVESGRKIIVTLAENPSTGYSWRTNVKKTTATILENKYIPPENRKPGKGGTRKVKLKVTGSGELVMKYCRPQENEAIKKFIIFLEAQQ